MSGKARAIGRGAIVAFLAVASITGTAHAAEDGSTSRYRLRTGNGPERLAMICDGWAEDTAARWRLHEVDGDAIPGASGDRYVLKCVGGTS